jgi:signal transduction histidine kinase
MSTVLLVDDSPTDRALITAILSRGGFLVHELTRGGETRPKALELRPLAIILDVNLPDTDGLSVCRELKADPVLSNTPVLILTVQGDEQAMLAGLEAGADDYVAKDAAPGIFLARVKRLVHDRQMTIVAAINQQLAQLGRLLAGIVHEIRGPLAVIRGNAEILRMSLGEAHEGNRYIEPIVRNSQVLQQRLEHLMATVRGGGSARSLLDVAPLVQEAADLFIKSSDPRAVKLTIELECDPGLPRVLADPGRLIQVLMNLLGNAQEAFQANRREGRIAIRATTRATDRGRWLVVEIRDDGPGIPEAYLDRIFEPFFTTKSEGTGYGLYLSSEILREHGGRLTVRNQIPTGACFTLWLPVPDAPQPQSEPAP